MLQHAHWFSGYEPTNNSAEASWKLLQNVKRSMPSLDEMVYDHWERSIHMDDTPDFDEVWDDCEKDEYLEWEQGLPSHWFDEHHEQGVGDLIASCIDYESLNKLYINV